MQAIDYIDADIPFLKSSDTVQFALDMMVANAVTEMPVLQERKYLGMVDEDMLYNFDNSDVQLGEVQLEHANIFAYEGEHVFELIKKMIEHNLFLMPIVGIDNEYAGIANAKSILKKWGNNSSLTEPGGMLVLEMNKSDYSLSEIARIVESSDALILNCFISSHADVSQIEVTIKLNKSDLKEVIASFERFDYTVKAAYHEAGNADDIQHRYESLMHYLNM